MRDVFIPTGNCQKLAGMCDELLRSPMGLEMGTVIGPAGRGKTYAAQRVVTANLETVYIRSTEKITPTGVFREVAFALGGARPRSTQACFDIIQAELQYRRRIILVDEADRLGIRHLNAFRDIHDICRVPVVLIGEEPLAHKVKQERRLQSRISYDLRFEPVGTGDVGVFYRLALGQTLNSGQGARLAKHAEGDFRMVVNDAIQIERKMVASGIERITDELIDSVCGNESGNGSPKSNGGGK